nr:MAG: nucleoprotein [Lantra virus]UQS95371.1 MAG: nucleoprotein [Lantra virus]
MPKPTGNVKRIGFPDSDPITEFKVAIKDDVHYPSEWFVNNPGKKPKIRFPEIEGTLDLYRKAVGSTIFLGKTELNHAIAYLKLKMESIEEVPTEDWKSFDVLIGAGGSKVNGLSMMEIGSVIGEKITVTDIDSSSITADDDEWLMMAVTCVLRINANQNPEYRIKLKTNFEERLRARGCDSPNVDLFSINYLNWGSNMTYVKLCNAIDMFFIKFPLNLYAETRLGTIGTRFYACAVLLAVEEIKGLLEIITENLAYWLWLPSLAIEFQRLFKGSEELDKKDSYTPYMIGFELTTKSPYSSSINPNLHYFLHVVGSSCNYERSKNALMIKGSGGTDTLMNAIVTAYANRSVTDFGMQFSVGGGEVAEVEVQLDINDPEPSTRDPRDWFNYIKDNKNRVPDHLYKKCSAVWSSWTEVRPNTVGKHLQGLCENE